MPGHHRLGRAGIQRPCKSACFGPPSRHRGRHRLSTSGAQRTRRNVDAALLRQLHPLVAGRVRLHRVEVERLRQRSAGLANRLPLVPRLREPRDQSGDVLGRNTINLTHGGTSPRAARRTRTSRTHTAFDDSPLARGRVQLLRSLAHACASLVYPVLQHPGYLLRFRRRSGRRRPRSPGSSRRRPPGESRSRRPPRATR
jgi:hypothetical protein